MKQVYLPPAEIRSLIGKSRETIQRMVLAALHNAGIDVSQPKRIAWKRTREDGCLLVGPLRS